MLGEDMAVKCPLCGEYEGSPQQVQAHISSKKDALHEGRYGREFEDELNRQANGQQAGQERQSASKSQSKGTAQNTGQNTPTGAGGQATGQQAPHRGGRAKGTTVDLPNIECKECGRQVKYPELMTYKATCPGCGHTIRKREAFEELEEQADEKGKDELAEAKQV